MIRFAPRVAVGAIVFTALLASCADSIPTALVPGDRPVFAVGASEPACVSSPDYVVSNQAALSAALAAAAPGSTVAIDGVIEVTGFVSIQGNGIRLTCATPGSGLITRTGTFSPQLLQVTGNDVQVDNRSEEHTS